MKLDFLKKLNTKVVVLIVVAAVLVIGGGTALALSSGQKSGEISEQEAKTAAFAHAGVSESDIVALKRDGVVSYYYCDSVGFREIPDFGRKSILKRLECNCKADDKKKTKMRSIER